MGIDDNKDCIVMLCRGYIPYFLLRTRPETLNPKPKPIRRSLRNSFLIPRATVPCYGAAGDFTRPCWTHALVLALEVVW